MAVGIFWTLLGAWVILPFSGLEALLIAGIFYKVSLNSYQRQVITIGEDAIRVQTGIYYPRRTWILQRHTTSLELKSPEKPMDIVELSFRDRELRLPLGRFLNEEDRKMTIDLLRDAGMRILRHPRDQGQ